MSENTVKTIFKIVGILHILYALFTIAIACLSIFAAATLLQSDQLLSTMGEETTTVATYGLIGAGTILSLVIGIGYGLSAFGFLAMKKWQPVVFTIIVVLSILDMIVNAIQNGIQLMSIVSVVFFFIWVGVLVLVWKNKPLFNR